MKAFFDGTVDMSLQTNPEGFVVLSAADAAATASFRNPLRDPLVLVRRDGRLHMRDGYHRLHEARARGFRGRVWCAVLDMDADEEE